MKLHQTQLRALWWRAQLLEPRPQPGDPAGIVRTIGAIQSQEPPAAALALRARGGGFDASQVESARVEDRSVVRTWCQRGTIHLVATEDLGWMLELLRETLIAGRASRWRNLALDETTYEKARRSLRKALADGPLTRAEIGERWRASGIDATGQRLPHLISRAAIDGDICDGPDRGRDRSWVLLEEWTNLPQGPEGNRPWGSWPGGIWWDTAPPSRVTSPSGRGSRSRTPAAPGRRSKTSSRSSRLPGGRAG